MKHLTFITTFLLHSFVLLGQYDIVFDSTFSGDGVVTLPYGFTAERSVFLQSDGKILLMGQKNFSNDSFDFTMIRIDATGALDASYNNTGINNAPVLFGENYYGPKGVLLPNNDFIAADMTGFTPWFTRDVVLHKYLANGIKDGSFGNAGALVIKVDSLSLECRDLEVFNDTTLFLLTGGDFFGVDTFIRKNLLYKINSKGIIDSSFATNGVFEIPESMLYYAGKMAIGEDGSIFLLGNTRYTPGGVDSTKIVKLNADLTMDTGFQFSTTDWHSYITEIGLDEDAKLVIYATKISSGFKIWRLFQDGSPDNSFSKDGAFDGDFNILMGGPTRFVEQPDGKLLFPLGAGAAALRINSNGSLDYGFDLDGIADIIHYTDELNSYGLSSGGLELQPDGKMVIMTETESGLIKVIRVTTRP